MEFLTQIIGRGIHEKKPYQIRGIVGSIYNYLIIYNDTWPLLENKLNFANDPTQALDQLADETIDIRELLSEKYSYINLDQAKDQRRMMEIIKKMIRKGYYQPH